MTALFDASPQVTRLTTEEHQAIEVFARAGFEVEVLRTPDRVGPRPVARLPRRRRVA